MPIAELEDGNIHYTVSGQGHPLLMLLPQSSGPVGIAPFLGALSERFTVIRYDQRGTGRSDPIAAPDGMSMAARAAEVAGLLDALEIGKAALCCHSTGCGIGVATVSHYPDRIDGLVLASPWSHGDGHLTTMQRLRVAAARGLDPYRYAWFNASLLFPPDYRRAHETGFEAMAVAAKDNPQNADEIEGRLNAILSFDARPALPEIACRTLVATGRDDQLMPDWFGREIAAAIPEAHLLALDGGGHMLPETRGAALADAIIDFLG